MPSWMRVIRGMIGTGLTFAMGVGGAAALVGTVVWLRHGITGREVFGIGGKFAVASFLLGLVFSGVLALAARGRQFNKLSLHLVAAIGAGAGLLYFAFLAANGGRNWTPRLAIINFVLLIVMGAGSATATVLIARRATSSLESGDELDSLAAGDADLVARRHSSTTSARKRD